MSFSTHELKRIKELHERMKNHPLHKSGSQAGKKTGGEKSKYSILQVEE